MRWLVLHWISERIVLRLSFAVAKTRHQDWEIPEILPPSKYREQNPSIHGWDPQKENKQSARVSLRCSRQLFLSKWSAFIAISLIKT